MKIQPFNKLHFPLVQAIYQHGINTGNATFQEQAKGWEEWDASFLPTCRLVAELNGNIAGWAALSPVSNRCVYGGVAEVSIYVAGDAKGKGIGTSLLHELILASENAGVWTLQAGIFLENEPSIKIHLKNGFKRVGVREKLGKMKQVWRDVLLMERRSNITGL